MTWTGILEYIAALFPGPLRFRYPLGTRVHWSGSPDGTQPWEVCMRRSTEGPVSTFVEYLLVSPAHQHARWAYEPDCEEMP